MSETTLTPAVPPVSPPVIQAPRPAVPAPVKACTHADPSHPDAEWNAATELGQAVAHMKAWFHREREKNAVVPTPDVGP